MQVVVSDEALKATVGPSSYSYVHVTWGFITCAPNPAQLLRAIGRRPPQHCTLHLSLRCVTSFSGIPQT